MISSQARFGNSTTQEYRYERKFLISNISKQEVESILRLHPAMFTEIYHVRYVNNLYMDSLELYNYFTTVGGNPLRAKIRIRWYGELYGNIEKPLLEIKIKNGLLGKKLSFPLIPFELGNNLNIDILDNVFRKSEIPDVLYDTLRSFRPTLLNRYLRKYFQSKDRKFRVTLDSNQSFFQAGSYNSSFINRRQDAVSVILEMKYDKNLDDYANFMTQTFPFRMSRNSKYVKGIECLYS